MLVDVDQVVRELSVLCAAALCTSCLLYACFAWFA